MNRLFYLWEKGKTYRIRKKNRKRVLKYFIKYGSNYTDLDKYLKK